MMSIQWTEPSHPYDTTMGFENQKEFWDKMLSINQFNKRKWNSISNDVRKQWTGYLRTKIL